MLLMTGSLRVCQVANAVDETSIPADIAVGLARHTDIESGILGWYSVDGFDGDDHVTTHTVGAEGGYVDPGAHRQTREILSDYDIVQTHHNHSGSYAKVTARRLDKTIVSTEQNTHDGFTRIGRIANGVTNGLADRVTCISRAVQASFQRWERLFTPSSNVEIIHNGVPFDRIRRSATEAQTPDGVPPTANRDFLIANAAMCTEQKAQDTLVRAVSRLRDRTDIDAHLCIAGDGQLRSSLEELASTLGIKDAVHFLGLIDRQEVYALARAADCFAMPSRWEGFCVAVAEAMAVGTPCVLSKIDVFEGLYGDHALFHPVDDIDTLADSLAVLCGDDDRRRSLANAGRDLIAERYSLETVCSAYMDLYRRLQ